MIVAPYSWVATANVIELCGATPVFVDIDPATFNMDAATACAQRLEQLADAARSARFERSCRCTRSATPPASARSSTIAAEFSIPVVEDAACALGATDDGRPAGSLGTIGCFSFHPRKIITTGEGGMIVTDDDEIAGFARTFRNHGQRVVDGTNEFVMAGDNLRLTDLQAAIGVAQMARLAGLVEARTRLAQRYDELLSPLGFEPQRRSTRCRSAVVRGPVPIVRLRRTR